MRFICLLHSPYGMKLARMQICVSTLTCSRDRIQKLRSFKLTDCDTCVLVFREAARNACWFQVQFPSMNVGWLVANGSRLMGDAEGNVVPLAPWRCSIRSVAVCNTQALRGARLTGRREALPPATAE
jgi:hypothetical protein